MSHFDRSDTRPTTLVLLGIPVVVLLELARPARQKSALAEALSRLVVLIGLGFSSVPRIVSVLLRKKYLRGDRG